MDIRLCGLSLQTFFDVESHQPIIAANPCNTILYQHCLNIEMIERQHPRFQVIRHARYVESDTIVIAAPNIALVVFIFKKQGNRTFFPFLKLFLPRW